MMEGRKEGITEGHQDGIKDLLESGGIALKIEADADALNVFMAAHGRYKQEGPDALIVSTPLLKVTLGDQKIMDEGTLGLTFRTTFAPGPHSQDLRCIIAGEIITVAGMDITPEDWVIFADKLIERNAALGLAVPELEGAVPIPYRAEYFHAPGRLFDTPRNVTKGRQENLPAIERWYLQTAFNRTIGMAAAALTKTDTREAIMDWQSATVEEVADLVFCRSEEGAPAHGQNRQDILKAFEALRAIPVPIVKIDWKKIGTDRNPRWVKEYKLRIASLFQSYGAVFIDKQTGKRAVAADPSQKKNLIKGKKDRRKSIKELIAQNPADGILESFPPDRFTLTGFEWRWNTDIAEDFICPQVALDKTGRPRLKLKKGRHIEGSRFINLNRRYFAVQKHLREAGSTYAPRLLDLIVSEKTHITSRGKGAVWIEIESSKVIKWLGLWPEYAVRPTHVLEDHIAPAIMLLIREKVMLPESWLVPQIDKNPDRRKSPFFRWKVAELWSTVALVPEDEAKKIEDELVRQAEAKDAAELESDQLTFPGMGTTEPIPSGPDIRAAREAAGINLRDFARMMKGPAIGTWSHYETGTPIRVKKIPPDVWKRVRDFIKQYGKKDLK